MFADPQVEHLGLAQAVPTDDHRPLRVVGQPFSLSRTPSRMAMAPPEIGQHTDEVLREFGFSAEEISTLRQAKAI